MSQHLSTQEFVELLDGHLAANRAQHLDHCAGCVGRMAELRTTLHAAEAGGDIPEPSPLFWDHFSARVRAATAEAVPARPSWWVSGWRPLVGIATVVIAVGLASVIRRQPAAPVSEGASLVTSDGGESAASQSADDASLNFMAELASSVPFEELRQVTRPSSDATDALVADLTPQQRAELARLIKIDKGSGE